MTISTSMASTKITLYFKDLFGNQHTITTEPERTINGLKEIIGTIRNVTAGKVRLYHIVHGDRSQMKIGDRGYPDGTMGLKLDDNKTLAEQGVVNGSKFDLMISML